MLCCPTSLPLVRTPIKALCSHGGRSSYGILGLSPTVMHQTRSTFWCMTTEFQQVISRSVHTLMGRGYAAATWIYQLMISSCILWLRLLVFMSWLMTCCRRSHVQYQLIYYSTLYSRTVSTMSSNPFKHSWEAVRQWPTVNIASQIMRHGVGAILLQALQHITVHWLCPIAIQIPIHQPFCKKSQVFMPMLSLADFEDITHLQITGASSYLAVSVILITWTSFNAKLFCLHTGRFV